jgi:hypothetical protein
MADTIFYRPHLSRLADDGTLTMPVSIYGDVSHSSALMEVPPTAKDHAFWRWIVMQKRFARVLDERAVADARAEYDRFCEWRDGIRGATPGA